MTDFYTILLLTVGILKIFVPLRKAYGEPEVDKRINHMLLTKNSMVDYDNVRHQFLTEYRRTNPITREEETKNYFKLMRCKSIFKKDRSKENIEQTEKWEAIFNNYLRYHSPGGARILNSYQNMNFRISDNRDQNSSLAQRGDSGDKNQIQPANRLNQIASINSNSLTSNAYAFSRPQFGMNNRGRFNF